MAKGIGRKSDVDGLFVERKHQNPILGSRVFVVEFPDGEHKDIVYNLLAEQLYSQGFSEGKQYRLFKEMINHRKCKLAIEKVDQYRIDKRTGR